jgi:ABC-type transporter Mla subunit MlaD
MAKASKRKVDKLDAKLDKVIEEVQAAFTQYAERVNKVVTDTNAVFAQHRERFDNLEAVHYTLYGPFGKIKAPKC